VNALRPSTVLLVLPLLVLSGCASYHALPLPQRVGSAAAGDIRVDPARMPTRHLASHRFDPTDGLDVTETAMLAVANNPDLKVMRDDAGIAHAQAFAAGLLPDPQVNWSQDFVTGGSGGAGATSPFGLGISYDVGKLLTYSTRTRAARWTEKQVDLNLLWAEWQTVAQARLLFARTRSEHAEVQRLQAESVALQPLRDHIQAALADGNLSYDLASTGLNAAADARRQLTAAQTQLNQTRHALRQLLGLTPQAPLHLVGGIDATPPGAAQLRTALSNLPDRRPDLLALQAGYHSQNQTLRKAIIQQFPAINVGFNRTRDNSAVYTSGFAIGLTLPLFDRNRGNIAIARATRQRLHDDYAARLLATDNDVDRLRRQLLLEQAALPAAEAHARHLDRGLRHAQQAWQARQLDLPTYLSLRSSALNADLQLTALRQTAAETAIALRTLLGTDWRDPASATLHADASSATARNP